MSEIENYRIDFVARTKEILEQYFDKFEKDNREFTFLLNCLLGLIVTVTEYEKRRNNIFRGRIDDSLLELIPERIGFIKEYDAADITDVSLTKLQVTIGHKNDLKEKDKLWFFKKIRNSIAHQNIERINEDRKWIGVRLWNENSSKKDFEIVFTVEEMKRLAVYLADRYLKKNAT